MAAATVNFQKKVVLGSFNVEWVNVTADDTNTIETLMQNPQHAIAVSNADASDSNNTNASISGKTITLNNANLSSTEVNVLVVGF